MRAILLLLACSLISNGALRTPTIPSLVGVPYRIGQVVDRSLIDSIQFRYISVATEALASEVRSMLASGQAEFGALAKTVSLDSMTKENGGLAGWVSLSTTTTDSSTDSELYPREVINKACFMSKGDISVVSNADSSLWFVVQLVDVLSRLAPHLVKRRKDAYWQQALGTTDATDASNGANLSYMVDTMGCQMNVADSERMEGQLRALGFVKSQEPFVAHEQPKMKDAIVVVGGGEGGEQSLSTIGTAQTGPSVVILNTCSIRDHSEQKAMSYLGPHAARKRKGENLVIVMAGCVAQQEGEKLLRRFPEIDIVMGPQYAPHLTELLQKVADGHQVVATDPLVQTEAQHDSPHSPPTPPLRRSDITAYVNVIFGCNERCTYCVVPQTRGVEQSRTKDAIVAEISDLVAEGFQEVTLLGQNIDSWGRDFTPKQRFADLLEAVGRVPNLQRLRFLTSHPKYLSSRVVSAMADNPRVIMPNVNVPFQSGSNRVLRLMRRGYTRERYLEIVASIRAAMPDASITADCIVGFPGETEEDFQQTLTLMEAVQFDVVNTAAYSARPGTAAAEWEHDGALPETETETKSDTDTAAAAAPEEEGQGHERAHATTETTETAKMIAMRVDEATKQSRLQRINALGETHALNRSRRFLGRVMPVLVEDVSLKNPRLCVGRIPHSRLCYFEGEFSELKGKVVDVEITEAKAFSLVGRRVAP